MMIKNDFCLLFFQYLLKQIECFFFFFSLESRQPWLQNGQKYCLTLCRDLGLVTKPGPGNRDWPNIVGVGPAL